MKHKMLGPTTRESDQQAWGPTNLHSQAPSRRATERSLVPAFLRIALWNAGRGHASEGNECDTLGSKECKILSKQGY